MEVLLAAGLCMERWVVWAATGVCGVAAAGLVMEMLGHSGMCGCLGTLMRMSSGQHMLLNGTVGALAVLVVVERLEARAAMRSFPKQ